MDKPANACAMSSTQWFPILNVINADAPSPVRDNPIPDTTVK